MVNGKAPSWEEGYLIIIHTIRIITFLPVQKKIPSLHYIDHIGIGVDM